MSQHRTKVRLRLNPQTLWHLERFAAADGHPGDVGRVVDKIVREKLARQKEEQACVQTNMDRIYVGRTGRDGGGRR